MHAVEVLHALQDLKYVLPQEQVLQAVWVHVYVIVDAVIQQLEDTVQVPLP